MCLAGGRVIVGYYHAAAFRGDLTVLPTYDPVLHGEAVMGHFSYASTYADRVGIDQRAAETAVRRRQYRPDTAALAAKADAIQIRDARALEEPKINCVV